jgi:hypothetical protein
VRGLRGREPWKLDSLPAPHDDMARRAWRFGLFGSAAALARARCPARGRAARRPPPCSPPALRGLGAPIVQNGASNPVYP